MSIELDDDDVYDMDGDDLQEEVMSLRAKNKLLEAALQEASEFAVKRLPHDMRETNADDKYFRELFTAVAAAKLREEEKNVYQSATPAA